MSEEKLDLILALKARKEGRPWSHDTVCNGAEKLLTENTALEAKNAELETRVKELEEKAKGMRTAYDLAQSIIKDLREGENTEPWKIKTPPAKDKEDDDIH